MRRDKKRVFEEYLVVSAQGGDRKAFERLAALWQPALMRHAWRLTGDHDLAADTLQDAWLDIVRGLPRLGDAAAFPAWAYRIVTRKCANSIRKLQRVRRIKQAAAQQPPPDERSAERAEQSADLLSVKEAIAGLPPEQRSAMALFHGRELSVAEIAIALDVPVGTVKTRLMHARRKIRAALEPQTEGDGHEPG